MFIDFGAIEQRMDMIHFIVLQSVKQKDNYHEAYPECVMDLKEEGYIEQQKNGGYRLTEKGNTFLFMVTEIHAGEEANALASRLIDMYERRDKKYGKRAEVISRIAWFISASMFSDSAIESAVEDYLSSSGEYTMALENLIWKPVNAFTVHKNLKDSKLFDIIYNKHKVIDPRFFFDDKFRDKDVRWMLAVSKLPEVPKKISDECTFTGSVKGDEEAITRIKKRLYDRIRNRK